MERLIIRQAILKKTYQLFPFNLKGGLQQPLPPAKDNFISCLICTNRNPETLEKLLMDIAEQTLGKDQFEIIIVDNSLEGAQSTIEKYAKMLSIQSIRETSKEGLISNLRNETLQRAQGTYILFLDDDTRLLQKDFLQRALMIFKELNVDMIMPYAQGLPYSFATRCCLYRRTILETLNGFQSNLSAYEDIELGLRVVLWGARTLKTNALTYQHPAFFFDSLQKPLAIGQTILKLRNIYPWYIWLFIYLNALRFLPLGLIPTTCNRQWFKISLGVLMAPFFRKKFTY